MWYCVALRFLQSVLGALIAVNLKNTLLQLSDPYYLWQKSRLDCVSLGHASQCRTLSCKVVPLFFPVLM